MNLLEIPEEVIEGHLLPLLQWNDLLRFRRVCQVTKAITQGYLKVHAALAPEIEINEEDRTFKKFLDMGIPTTRIYLKNTSGYEFYEKQAKNVKLFLKRFGGIVISLRVNQLSLVMFGKELTFLEGLPNLQHLDIGHFSYGMNEDCPQTGQERAAAVIKYSDRVSRDARARNHITSPIVPNVVKHLKVLKIGQKLNAWNHARDKIDRTGLQFLADNEAILDYVSFPFNSHAEAIKDLPIPVELRNPNADFSMDVMFRFVKYLIDKRAGSPNPDQRPIAKVVDFVNFHDGKIINEANLLACRSFQALCNACALLGIQLKNVSPLWLMHRRGPQVGVPILSLTGLHPNMISLEMPNLEKISFRTTTQFGCVGPRWRAERRDWPALKTLDLTVNCDTMFYLTYDRDPMFNVQGMNSENAKTVLKFLFQDIKRPKVEELRLNFTEKPEGVTIPKMGDIVGACPNLKKLTLAYWPGTNKALTELFGGLSNLEEVSLENCKNLGNVAFVGVDKSQPLFLKLKKLRKLSLKGLDQMPKITNLLFTLVIRHLNLSHLTLTSDAPVKSVTSSGIRALLEGSFAQSIEKFSLQHLLLDGVSAKELKDLEKQFRSDNML